MPLVTTLIPIWNVQSDWLQTCLQSVNAQNFSDHECLIVSDGCPDQKILDDIEHYCHLNSKFRLFHRPHRGIAHALNFGLSMTESKYVARLDCDDFNVGERLQKQFKFMEDNPQITLCGGSMCDTDGKMKYIPHCPKITTLKGFREAVSRNSTYIFHPTYFFRRAEVEEYPTDYEHSEDTAFICKLVLKHRKIDNLPDILVAHRLHPNRMSAINRDAQVRNTIRAIEEILGGI